MSIIVPNSGEAAFEVYWQKIGRLAAYCKVPRTEYFILVYYVQYKD